MQRSMDQIKFSVHLLEDYDVEPTIKIHRNFKYVEEKSYIGIFNESIKCHHNDIANYIINKYLQKEDENSYDTFVHSLKYYNFSFMLNEHINESSFGHLCHYDYYSLVKFLYMNKDVNINRKIIQYHIF